LNGVYSSSVTLYFGRYVCWLGIYFTNLLVIRKSFAKRAKAAIGDLFFVKLIQALILTKINVLSSKWSQQLRPFNERSPLILHFREGHWNFFNYFFFTRFSISSFFVFVFFCRIIKRPLRRKTHLANFHFVYQAPHDSPASLVPHAVVLFSDFMLFLWR
jgi:hypothetical protein